MIKYEILSLHKAIPIGKGMPQMFVAGVDAGETTTIERYGDWFVVTVSGQRRDVHVNNVWWSLAAGSPAELEELPPTLKTGSPSKSFSEAADHSRCFDESGGLGHGHSRESVAAQLQTLTPAQREAWHKAQRHIPTIDQKFDYMKKGRKP